MRKMLSIFFLAVVVNLLHAQDLSQKESARVDAFQAHMEGSDVFKTLKADKEKCEQLALLMKNSKLADGEKRGAQQLYDETKKHYDLLIDGVIEEMRASRTPGAAISVFLEKGGKNGEFNQVAAIANRKARAFQHLSMDRLEIYSSGPLAEWIDKVLTLLMPPWLKKISDVAFEIVKGMLVRKLEGMKMKAWDEL